MVCNNRIPFDPLMCHTRFEDIPVKRKLFGHVMGLALLKPSPPPSQSSHLHFRPRHHLYLQHRVFLAHSSNVFLTDPVISFIIKRRLHFRVNRNFQNNPSEHFQAFKSMFKRHFKFLTTHFKFRQQVDRNLGLVHKVHWILCHTFLGCSRIAE